jgi:hypothetical protein
MVMIVIYFLWYPIISKLTEIDVVKKITPKKPNNRALFIDVMTVIFYGQIVRQTIWRELDGLLVTRLGLEKDRQRSYVP